MSGVTCDVACLLLDGSEVPSSVMLRTYSALIQLASEQTTLAILATLAADPSRPVPATYRDGFSALDLLDGTGRLDYDVATVIRNALVGDSGDFSVVRPHQ